MRKKLTVIGKNYFRQIPPVVLIVLTIQAGFFVVYNNLGGKNNFLYAEELIKTFLIVGIAFWIISVILSKWRRISCIIKILLLYLYTLLLLYHYHAGTNLDFSILWDYKKEILYSEVLQMIYNTIGINTILFLLIFTLLIIVVQVKWGLFFKPLLSKILIPQFFILSFFLWLVYLIPIKSFDEITSFSKSFINWYRIHTVFSDYPYNNIHQYPYVNYFDSSISFSDINRKELPNIFFIVIESFNVHFVEKMTNSGKEITPFFDSLISKGVYIEHFYSNSDLTEKGHLSILFSILPSFRGAVFENFSSINLNSLPKILQSFNYKTVYYQAANSLNFQNEGPFLSNNGFELCKAAKSNLKKDIASWGTNYPQGGWGGVEDYVLYREFFETLDSLHVKEKEIDKKYFGFLATISSHRPWLRQKYDKALPYPHADKVEEDFANILFRVDSYLKLFFKELKKRPYLNNSIVIITGDHSCPAGEHGSMLNAVDLYDENCKIPFLMLWENKLQPVRLSETAWSQVDIAPSILDLLNIKVTNHFIGKSFFRRESEKSNIVHLVQPYSGLFFGTIIYPYKYVINVCDNKESLYNLSEDPGERKDLIEKFDQNKLAVLKNEINQFAINQFLIENNKIWPDSVKISSAR